MKTSLQHLETSMLLDMLSVYTSRYMRMMTEGGAQQEFEACREIVEELQQEIRYRNAECDIPSPVFARHGSIQHNGHS